jgi:hypothetical protein
MADEAFDPRALVLGKDVHPVELWSPGARVRIHVPAVPVAGTIIAGALGALAAGAVVIAAAAGAIWAARKFHEMFEEHDVTFDWTAHRATFRHGRSSRIVPFDEIRGLVLMGLKTRHEPGEANVTTAISYTAYWCRRMGSALARALDVGFRFEDYREMTAKEYFL